jgi:hypothetical protein
MILKFFIEFTMDRYCQTQMANEIDLPAIQFSVPSLITVNLKIGIIILESDICTLRVQVINKSCIKLHFILNDIIFVIK